MVELPAEAVEAGHQKLHDQYGTLCGADNGWCAELEAAQLTLMDALPLITAAGRGEEWQAGSGAALIAAERRRQVEVEGWTADHDAGHGPTVLLAAAKCYGWAAVGAEGNAKPAPALWPWARSWWKPKDRLRNLVRAGALAQAAADIALRWRDNYAAEIDRLLAAPAAEVGVCGVVHSPPGPPDRWLAARSEASQ